MAETIQFAGKFYFRSILLERAGDRVPQHRHDVAHPTLCGSGSAKYFVDGELMGTVVAGYAVEIEAGKLHEFVALEDGTRLTCVFDAEDAMRLQEKGY
jgi:quercetin dioxygenase-like cupin family protein